MPVSALRNGFQADADLSGVNFISANNTTLVESDFNETTYRGARLTGSWDVNDDWNLLVSHTTQDLEADGV